MFCPRGVDGVADVAGRVEFLVLLPDAAAIFEEVASIGCSGLAGPHQGVDHGLPHTRVILERGSVKRLPSQV
jgi:hypothetical protein